MWYDRQNAFTKVYPKPSHVKTRNRTNGRVEKLTRQGLNKCQIKAYRGNNKGRFNKYLTHTFLAPSLSLTCDTWWKCLYVFLPPPPVLLWRDIFHFISSNNVKKYVEYLFQGFWSEFLFAKMVKMCHMTIGLTHSLVWVTMSRPPPKMACIILMFHETPRP